MAKISIKTIRHGIVLSFILAQAHALLYNATILVNFALIIFVIRVLFLFSSFFIDKRWTFNTKFSKYLTEPNIVFRRFYFSFFFFFTFSFRLNRCHWLNYAQPSHTKIKIFRLPAVKIGSGRWLNDCFWHPASHYHPALCWILNMQLCVFVLTMRLNRNCYFNEQTVIEWTATLWLCWLYAPSNERQRAMDRR